MKKAFLIVFCLSFLLFTETVWSAMTSTNYQIPWDNFNQGGNELGTSTNFSVYDTVGGLATGTSTSANYQLAAGYRVPEDVLSFVVKSETKSTQTTYTAFSQSGKTVTVSDPSLFSVGVYIAVVENVGFSEKVAIGKITTISGSVLTVDGFNGAGSGMSASPSGGDDMAYVLSSHTQAFGTLQVGTQNVFVTMTSVQSSAPNGYTVYLRANQVLQNAVGQSIASVADGVVSLGNEEYGASTTGTRAYSPDTDLAVTTTQRVIQTASAISLSPADRVATIYKLAITANTNAGDYSQSLFYTLTANY